jgi:hypothetical protein
MRTGRKVASSGSFQRHSLRTKVCDIMLPLTTVKLQEPAFDEYNKKPID